MDPVVRQVIIVNLIFTVISAIVTAVIVGKIQLF